MLLLLLLHRARADGVTTLTTVGTFTPETPAGRLVTVVAILTGVAVVPYQLSRLAESALAAPRDDAPALLRRPDGDDDDGVAGVCGACGACDHRSDAGFCYACGAPLVTIDVGEQ